MTKQKHKWNLGYMSVNTIEADKAEKNYPAPQILGDISLDYYYWYSVII